ncbi:ComF family protein [Candidatus Saccharibacteria bacterium]|nr:ComF family protein [Candidatus Saccharibacteria bacterium]
MPNIVKNTTFFNPLDLIAPHSCRGCGALGNILCDRCKKYIIDCHQAICPNCKAKLENPNCPHCHDLPPIYVIGKRADLVGDLVHDLKYKSIRSIASSLAEVISQILPSPSCLTGIIPLPTISSHIRVRGLDHTLLIAKHLAKSHPNYQVKQLLIRAGNTVQVGANAKTRLSQATSAYKINPKVSIDPTIHYLLLDDVWTTGASMTAAVNILQQAGAANLSSVIIALSE